MAASRLATEALLDRARVAPGDRQTDKSIEGGLDGGALRVRIGVHRRGDRHDGQRGAIDLQAQLHVVDGARLALSVGPGSLIAQSTVELELIAVIEHSDLDGPDVHRLRFRSICQPGHHIVHRTSVTGGLLRGQTASR